MIRQLWVQADDYTAQDDRLLFPALMPGGGGPLGALVGVRAPGDLALTMTTGQAGTIGAGFAFIGWAGSVYCLANTEPEPVTFAPADAANARIDLVVARVYDSEAGGTDEAPDIAVIAGQASQTPVPPAVPAGALALWEVRYNAGASAPILTDRRTPAGGTPPPVTSGATTQSFTDSNGEVWVARAGVDGGLWRRARDVLHANYNRTLGWVIPATWTVFGFNQLVADNYGIYNGGNGVFTAPVAGWYRMHASIGGAVAGGGNVQIGFRNAAGATISQFIGYGTGAGTIVSATHVLVWLAAGGTVSTWNLAAPAMNGRAVGDVSFANFSFEGTG